MSAPSPATAPGDNAPPILRQDADGVALLTLDRPKSRNSLSRAMMAALHEALRAVGEDRAVRAVVLAANGPAFSAGHDLKEMTAHREDADGGRGYYEAAMAECGALMQAVVALPQPVIAAVCLLYTSPSPRD